LDFFATLVVFVGAFFVAIIDIGFWLEIAYRPALQRCLPFTDYIRYLVFFSLTNHFAFAMCYYYSHTCSLRYVNTHTPFLREHNHFWHSTALESSLSNGTPFKAFGFLKLFTLDFCRHHVSTHIRPVWLLRFHPSKCVQLPLSWGTRSRLEYVVHIAS
jgi:hypothetical protein